MVYRALAAGDDGPTLLDSLTELVELAATPEGRARLGSITVEVTRNRPRARIIRNGATTDYRDLAGLGLTKEQEAARGRGARAEITCIITEATIIAFGAALGASRERSEKAAAEPRPHPTVASATPSADPTPGGGGV